MSSIFQAGGALHAYHSTYIERRADYDALNAALDDRGTLLHVIAPRQEGKSSLLKRLMHRLGEKGWRCAYIDLSILIGLNKTSWFTELGKELARTLTPGQEPILTNQIEMRRYLINQALPLLNSQPHIAIFLDEVESACKAQDDAGRSFSDEFFMTFRNLYNQRDDYDGTLFVALAGTANPKDLVKDPSISPFNVGQKIGLGDFAPIEAHSLTNRLADLGLAVEDSIHEGIYEWTNGHPYLTQCICFELEKAARNGYLNEITLDYMNVIVKQIILNPPTPLLRDKNLEHVTKTLDNLTRPASGIWTRLSAGEVVSREETNDDVEWELYLTGVITIRANRIVIRNHIYEEAFLKRRGELKADKSKPGTIEIFYSYAYEDEQLRNELEKHLSHLKLQGLIAGWYDHEISAGKEWAREIEKHLNAAQIILLLVSPDFIASEYCYSIEMKRAMEKHEAGEARIIPIILRSVDWQGMPFGKLKALPKNAKPVIRWRNRDDAFLDVVTSIRKVIEELNAK